MKNLGLYRPRWWILTADLLEFCEKSLINLEVNSWKKRGFFSKVILIVGDCSEKQLAGTIAISLFIQNKTISTCMYIYIYIHMFHGI